MDPYHGSAEYDAHGAPQHGQAPTAHGYGRPHDGYGHPETSDGYGHHPQPPTPHDQQASWMSADGRSAYSSRAGGTDSNYGTPAQPQQQPEVVIESGETIAAMELTIEQLSANPPLSDASEYMVVWAVTDSAKAESARRSAGLPPSNPVTDSTDWAPAQESGVVLFNQPFRVASIVVPANTPDATPAHLLKVLQFALYDSKDPQSPLGTAKANLYLMKGSLRRTDLRTTMTAGGSALLRVTVRMKENTDGRVKFRPSAAVEQLPSYVQDALMEPGPEGPERRSRKVPTERDHQPLHHVSRSAQDQFNSPGSPSTRNRRKNRHLDNDRLRVLEGKWVMDWPILARNLGVGLVAGAAFGITVGAVMGHVVGTKVVVGATAKSAGTTKIVSNVGHGAMLGGATGAGCGVVTAGIASATVKSLKPTKFVSGHECEEEERLHKPPHQSPSPPPNIRYPRKDYR